MRFTNCATDIHRKTVNALAVLLAVIALAGCAIKPPNVKRVEFGQCIWSESQRKAGVLFQDGAQTIPVDGGTLWLFGDTFVGRAQPGQQPNRSQIIGAQSTTIALLPAGAANLPPALNYFTDESGMATNPLVIFPQELAQHRRMWPTGGISIGSKIYMFYSMVEETDAPAPWNFRGVGGGLAVAEKPLGAFRRLQPEDNWQFPVEPIQVIREGNWLYLFEISSEPKGLVLARVRAGQIEQPAEYEFFVGNGWSTNRTNVKLILQEAYGQVSIVWLPSRKRFLMATSSDFFHPREIQFRESKNLEGPWSAPTRIAVPDLPGKTTTLIYGTFFHPELGNGEPLRFVLTFCRALAGEWELSNPEWLTVTLSPRGD